MHHVAGERGVVQGVKVQVVGALIQELRTEMGAFGDGQKLDPVVTLGSLEGLGEAGRDGVCAPQCFAILLVPLQD